MSYELDFKFCAITSLHINFSLIRTNAHPEKGIELILNFPPQLVNGTVPIGYRNLG